MINLSIITATHNVENTISSCLVSLKEQSMPIEHLVMDGLSSDSTLEIVKSVTSDRLLVTGEGKSKTKNGSQATSHQFPVTRMISEKDNGLYDALNKGIQMSRGDVVGILHADDFYADAEVLARVSEVFEDPSVDACYGDLLYVAEGRGTRVEETLNQNQLPVTSHQSQNFAIKRYWKSGDYSPRKFYFGWMPPHPTFFVRKSVYEKYGLFNLDLGTAADYELMLRFLVKHQIRCEYIPEVLVKMRVGGVSNASLGNRLRANRMDREAWAVNGLRPYPWTIPFKPIRKIPQYIRRPGTRDVVRGTRTS
jgi:glycosyltransferase